MRFGPGIAFTRRNVRAPSEILPAIFTFGHQLDGPLDTSAGSPMGQGMASLLYGLPTGGKLLHRQRITRKQDKVLATYLQDDWRVSRKLTLSLGLRYELPSPMTERFNRSVQGFDFERRQPESRPRAEPTTPLIRFRKFPRTNSACSAD